MCWENQTMFHTQAAQADMDGHPEMSCLLTASSQCPCHLITWDLHSLSYGGHHVTCGPHFIAMAPCLGHKIWESRLEIAGQVRKGVWGAVKAECWNKQCGPNQSSWSSIIQWLFIEHLPYARSETHTDKEGWWGFWEQDLESKSGLLGYLCSKARGKEEQNTRRGRV